MNIFVTDPDPVKSAQVLPDKHIVKMPLETCQMLAIVASPEWGYNFGTLPKLDGTPYKTSKGAFRGHPCTIWAQTNWSWLIEHGLALCYEYTHRYNKPLQALMSSNMIRPLIYSLHTNVTLHPNLGLHLTTYVTHPENQIGYDLLQTDM